MNIDNDELRKADKKAINEICDVFSMDEALAIFDNRLEAHAAAQRQALRDEVIDALSDGLDDIKGAANKTYYPFQDDEKRLEHIASATDELNTAISTIFEGSDDNSL